MWAQDAADQCASATRCFLRRTLTNEQAESQRREVSHLTSHSCPQERSLGMLRPWRCQDACMPLCPGPPSLALGPQSHSVVQNEAHVSSEALLGNPPLCYLRFPVCSVRISSPTLRAFPHQGSKSFQIHRSQSWGKFPTPAPVVPCSPVTPRHAERAERAGWLRVLAQPLFGAN